MIGSQEIVVPSDFRVFFLKRLTACLHCGIALLPVACGRFKPLVASLGFSILRIAASIDIDSGNWTGVEGTFPTFYGLAHLIDAERIYDLTKSENEYSYRHAAK